MSSALKKMLDFSPPDSPINRSITKRTSRSTDGRVSLGRFPEEQKKSPTLLFQCKNCKAILANSSSLFKVLRLQEKHFGISSREPTIVRHADEVLLVPDGEFDQFCVYNPVFCKLCEYELGKFYISMTERMDEAKGLYLIPESRLVIYDIETSKVLMTPKPKQPEPRFPESHSTRSDGIEITERKSLSSNKKDEKSGTQTPKNLLNKSFLGDEPSESGIKQVKQLNENFNELKGVLQGFAEILQQFDMRLSSSERTTQLINETLTHLYKEAKELQKDEDEDQ